MCVGAFGSEKRVSGPPKLEIKSVMSHWKVNLEPLEDQYALLTTEVSLQPHDF